jgi:hypothetical protein
MLILQTFLYLSDSETCEWGNGGMKYKSKNAEDEADGKTERAKESFSVKRHEKQRSD